MRDSHRAGPMTVAATFSLERACETGLDRDLPILELPIDRPRRATQTFKSARYPFSLSAALTAALRALSQRQGVTLHTTLLATFKTLLYRYTGQRDILVGSPASDRGYDADPDSIVFIDDILFLRTDLSGNPSFQTLLQRVDEAERQAWASRDLSAAALIDASRLPLPHVLFDFFETPMAVGTPRDLQGRPRELGGNISCDLSLAVEPRGEDLAVFIDYNVDLFDATTIERMAGHLGTLLEGIVADPDERLADLPILTETERWQLLLEWSSPRSDYPRDIGVPALFEEQVKQTPEAVALVWEDHCLTYGALNRRANQLAHYLRGLGVGVETLVGLCAERSFDMIVGMLGVLKSGGAYVPLDPDYPQDQLTFRLVDTRLPVLLTQQRLAERFSKQGAHVICLDTGWEGIARESEANPIHKTTADNLAYVMYTSGSTGRPKGSSIVQRSIVRLVRQTNYADLSADEVLLQFASNAFDASTLEIWGALLNGGRLVIYPAQMPSLEELGRVLQQQRVTTLWLTAGLFHLMVDERLEDLSALRQLLAGGDVLSVSHVRRVLQYLPGCRLINGYGPTENTTFTCCYPMTSESRIGATVPIGRPIANTQVYVLDAHLQPTPVGVPGELYAGGDGLARDYLNRPWLTAERFIPNPFSDEPGARLYKTGDLVRWLPDGDIEFLGRDDHQVKIRGFRVELGEIEATLGGHPQVRETVVLARQDALGSGKRLVAYVVPTGKDLSFVGELRRYLKAKLPEYMTPSAFVTLERLPLTPNGKIDRRVLPAPPRTRPELAQEFIAARTPVEEQLADVWSQVLGYDQIGIHDSFFDLGGHSLALTQVMSRVFETFQVEIPLSSMFETPTVASLAEGIERARDGAKDKAFLALEPSPRDGLLPLTFAQEQVWFLQELAPDNIAYHAQSTIRLGGPLDVGTLEQTLTEIVRRHEILRTTFPAVDGQPVQDIHPPWKVSLPVVDLNGVQAHRREVETEHLTLGVFRHPFDTRRLPLLRWTLLRLTDKDHILIQVEHHFVHDGWSFSVFFREMQALYEAFSAGFPSPLPELPVQYADFAVWQRRWMQGETAQAQLDYWKKQLAGDLPPVDLPSDRPRPKVQNLRGASYRTGLSPQLYEALKALSLDQGATLFMTLMAVFKLLLHRYTGQVDLPVGSSVANRRLSKSEGLIGMIVNMIVLRTDLSGNPTFRELLQRVRRVALDAYAHQDVPFGKLVEMLQPERDLSRNALFQVGFNFHDSPVPELAFSGLTGSIEYRQNESAKFDLNVLVIPRAEQLIGRGSQAREQPLTVIWEYDTDLFDVTTIARMADHFRVLLESIVLNPDQRLWDFSIMTEAERQRLLAEWNDTGRDYARDVCLHELFDLHVSRTPEATALILPATDGERHQDQRLSYRELGQRANQLAHYMQGLGVGPGVLVGVCVERSIDMVVGLLGVLKAGGAYVPLDPAFPQERIALMLEDARAALLLTQSHLLDQLPALDVPVVPLDKGWEEIACMPDTPPSSAVTADDLAYTIYTSGSTGKPKGVQILHRAVLNFLDSMRRCPGLTEEDTLLSVTTVSFDIAVLEIFLPLTTGARVMLAGREVATDGVQLLKVLADWDITVMQATPVTWQMLLEAGWEGDERLTILCGGEALPRELARQLVGRCAALWNMYGPTETTVWSLLYPIKTQDEAILIGRPIANTKLYLLDARMQPVPVGVPGELYIGGDGLARGYLSRPGLTAESFVPNPFSPPHSPPRGGGMAPKGGQGGTRLYRTGDLARYLPDGNVEFLGRTDHQVKIRGFRIELGEIEAVLAGHPEVSETVVLARQDVPGDRQLVAYVVPEGDGQWMVDKEHDASSVSGPPSLVADLRRYLRAKLPEYMLPSAFVSLEALPLTPNGKINRRALPAPDRSALDVETVFVAPQGPVEEMVAQVWVEALGLERIGIHDNFFALGGHSLLATRILARIRDAFQVEIALPDFFELPTVEGLAVAIEDVLIERLEALSEEEAQRLITAEG